MAPISWISLFIIFFITLIIFNMLNFYCFFINQSTFYKNNKESKMHDKNNNFFNWTW